MGKIHITEVNQPTLESTTKVGETKVYAKPVRPAQVLCCVSRHRCYARFWGFYVFTAIAQVKHQSWTQLAALATVCCMAAEELVRGIPQTRIHLPVGVTVKALESLIFDEKRAKIAQKVHVALNF